MENTGRIEELITWLAEVLRSPSTWFQLGVIAGTVLIAWLLHRYWGGYLADVRRDKTGLRRLTLGTGQRLIFPFTMLLLILVVRAATEQSGYSAGLLDVAVPLLVSLAAIRLTVYLLRKAFAQTRALRAWENTIAITVWIAVALHLLGWLPDILEALEALAVTVGSVRVSVLGVLKLVASVAFFLVLSLWLSAGLEKRLAVSEYLSPRLQVGLSKTVRVTLIAAGFLIALNAIGIELTTLTVFGGALGVGLGFGLQRIASNFVSGFILLFDRSIRPGDVISIGQSFGWVQELRARYVVVRDRDGVETLIPNENLITSEVINWSYSDPNVRVKFPVQVSYDDDPEKAMALMLEASRVSQRVLSHPQPVCRLMAFGDSGINLELRVWVSDPQEGISNVRSEINLAVWRAFREHGITIPFPQRDLHLHGPGIPTASIVPDP